MPAFQLSPKELMLGFMINTMCTPPDEATEEVRHEDVEVQLAYVEQQWLDGTSQAIKNVVSRQVAFDKWVCAGFHNGQLKETAAKVLAKVEYKDRAGPDAVQCPKVLGPHKHHPPHHFTPGEDDPDPPPAPTRNPALVISPTSMEVIPVQAAPFAPHQSQAPATNQELEFIDIDVALKGNADEGDDDDNKYNDTEHPNFAEEAPQQLIPWTLDLQRSELLMFTTSSQKSINVIKCLEFHQLLLLLHKDLWDADIPQHTKMWELIIEAWREYFVVLKNDLVKAEGRISCTADIWSDEVLRPFLALTTHWIGKSEGTMLLQLKAALLAFHHLPGNHTGDYIAQKFLHLLDHAEVTEKMSTP
ncbi:hypothetical protein EDC04DRAFT_2902646 [Pisolithus marmoratus]|nr:hypothetical protein EDC04DRAFT_2902646 [Pisolithus marmoratus]